MLLKNAIHAITILLFGLIIFVMPVSADDDERDRANVTITKVLTDPDLQELYIYGQDFDSSRQTPVVTLSKASNTAGIQLQIINHTSSLIAASLPNYILPGNYLLQVNTSRRYSDDDDDQKKGIASFNIAIGAIGPQGDKGDTGARGPQGDKGDRGFQGTTGLTGPRGINGPRGPTGLTGPQGIDGPRGPIGLTGPQGLDGLQGPKGDPVDLSSLPTEPQDGGLNASTNVTVCLTSTGEIWLDTLNNSCLLPLPCPDCALSCFDVVLVSIGGAKLAVVKLVKELTGLGLKEAKTLVDAAPSLIKAAVPSEEAINLKQSLEETGAGVDLEGVDCI